MTDRYNYFSAICEDVKNFIEWENIEVNHDNREEMADYLNDILFCNDSVTGNGSGSYTFNTWQAEENICHNWELIKEMASEFGYNMGELIEKGAETIDVCIRCYLLGSCIEYVINDILYN